MPGSWLLAGKMLAQCAGQQEQLSPQSLPSMPSMSDIMPAAIPAWWPVSVTVSELVPEWLQGISSAGAGALCGGCAQGTANDCMDVSSSNSNSSDRAVKECITWSRIVNSTVVSVPQRVRMRLVATKVRGRSRGMQALTNFAVPVRGGVPWESGRQIVLRRPVACCCFSGA